MAAARFEVVLLETRHVKATLSAMVVKTDRKDARGIAELLRMGWFRPVHAKSPAARETRALLVARKFLQAKLLDVELSILGNQRWTTLEASYHAEPGDTVFRPEALGPRPAKRRGLRAKVALARKLATVLHRMWLDGADFRWGKEVSAAA